jgi:hypothetical protein
VPWEIVFLPEAEKWFMSLNQRDTEKITGSLDRLAKHGPGLRRPVVGRIRGSQHHNMKELRSFGGNLRILFAFDPRQRAIMLVGGDKTNNWRGWYRMNIPKADRRFTEHLRREGGWPDLGRTSGGRSR